MFFALILFITTFCFYIYIMNKGTNATNINNNSGNIGCDVLRAREKIDTCALCLRGPIKPADRTQCIELDASVKLSGPELCITGVVGEDFCPCLTMQYRSDEAFPAYTIMKASEDNDFRVQALKAQDDDIIGVIGVSTTESVNPGDVVKVCKEGVFKVRMASGSMVYRGDRLKKSYTEDGVAMTTYAGTGVFGIALETKMSDSTFNWDNLGGSGDFDTEEVNIGPVANVSAICFSGPGYGHSHDGDVNIKIELWDGTQWVQVYTQNIPDGDEVYFNMINASFAVIPEVSKIRISSDPGQGDTFHNMSSLGIGFACPIAGTIVKACFIKSDNSYNY